MKKESLKIENLHVEREGKEILHGVNLQIASGEIVALMGPNGSGKSTLAGAIMGHPDCVVTKGRISVGDKDVTALTPDKRAKAGLFLSMQNPPEIPGLTLAEFLRAAYNEIHGKEIGPSDFRKILRDKADVLKMDPSLLARGLNEGFSGGERKKSEILQLMVLSPKFVILDETDSGLDVDALKVVGEGVAASRGSAQGMLIITHHLKLLEHLRPDRVAVMRSGIIIKQGGPELAREIQDSGFGE